MTPIPTHKGREVSRDNRGTPVGFCASLEWKRPIVWNGKAGMMPMNAQLLAKLELVSVSPNNLSFNAFRVTILNKVRGKVDISEFRFVDYISERAEDRDHRGTHANQLAAAKRDRWPWDVSASNDGWRFRGAQPHSTRRFCLVIEQYTDLFL